MVDTTVKTLFSPDRFKKVRLFRRGDGTFGFEEWHFHAEENSWALFGQYSVSHCDSPERAEAEARGRVGWLGDRDADA
jgi:hypothetical protein